ncbi:MAG: ABC transporter ATP-binding protein [Thermoanaerobaculia bacterium]
METPAIEVRALRKIFTAFGSRRRVVALDGIDFTVPAGEIFGLLGPNGAGKTTTVKVLLDLTRATEGDAFLLGTSSRRPESRLPVGYLPEGHRFPGYLTARQTLRIFGRMSGMGAGAIENRVPALLKRVGLAEWSDVRVKKFSKGMTQRLGLACALVHDPAVLLLDEPTDGVDPVGRREIRDILRGEADRGRAIFLNSHLLSEIELTCDRVAVLRKGKIAALGRIDELTRRESKYRMVASPISDSLLDGFIATGASVERSNGHLELSVRDVPHLNQLIDQARSAGVALSELAPIRSSLEDVFVGLIKMEGSEAVEQAGAPQEERR